MVSDVGNCGVTSAKDYNLLARLFLLELDQATREEVRSDTRFCAVLPEDLQAARVEFARLFTLSVYPYASVFLDDTPELNTESTAYVEQFYAQARFGLRPEWMVGAPDALGAELMCAAWLMERGEPDRAREVLREFVLPWAPVACLAIERNARLELYRTLAQVTREFLLEESEQLDRVSWRTPELFAFEPQEQDLHQVSEFLITPARCGVFLSKDDLGRIAADLKLPSGFGERGLMIASLLKSAGMQDCIPQTLGALQGVVAEWVTIYAAWACAYPRSSGLWLAWQKRAEMATELLGEMRRTASAGGK